MPYYDNDHADANSLNTNDRNLDSRKQAQLNDKYFQRITRKRINEYETQERNDGKTYYKNVHVNLYGSGQLGTKIRNAVTGEKYQYTVGSNEQIMLFSTALCTGENGMKSSLALFYDTPEQYESHMFMRLDINEKAKWYSNNITMKNV